MISLIFAGLFTLPVMGYGVEGIILMGLWGFCSYYIVEGALS